MSEVETTTTVSDDNKEKKVIHIHQHVHHHHEKLLTHMKFRPRISHFDRFNQASAQDTFRGFYVLFWIGMGFYILRTGVDYYYTHGTWLGWEFGNLITRDGLTLMASDAVMVLSTFLAIPYVKLMQWGWIPYYQIGHIIQHVVQFVFLFLSISWSYHRKWYWVQSGFFLLHSLAMMMKTHSYIAYNGFLSYRYHNLKQLENSHAILTKKSDDTTDDTRLSAQKQLQDLDDAIQSVKADLISPHGTLSFPANVTFRNYVDYLLIPTLVYELEYPRTDRIRWKYVVEKILATFGTFYILYITTEHYIIPMTAEFNETSQLPRALLNLTFPFLMNYLLIFYIIFECICNVFAEISMFADRNFYDDWWNSVTFDEFARKWNKPVHHFLLRHVYAYSITTYKLSKNNATILTFLLSSLLHELVLVVVTKKIRMYLFAFQMFQLPLIAIGRLPAVKNNKVLGNAFFWFGMMLGLPFLGTVYLVF